VHHHPEVEKGVPMVVTGLLQGGYSATC
jgi:hypothetical protein